MSFMSRYLMHDFATDDWRRMPMASWYVRCLARPIRTRKPDTMLARPQRRPAQRSARKAA